MQRPQPAAALMLFALGMQSCAPSQAPQSLADSITRAVYANDYDGTVASFDGGTRAQVSRAQIGDLSDKMHALGTYEGLTQVNTDAARGRFQFDATFSGGHMTVLLRLDPDGKVGAYRITPGAPTTSPATPPAA